ncbi:MAG: two pore domain potassium channel family protein [Brevundimonas sp.]|nr:MAG: two pore domain potassium channel family protein [Brevundimonas sp.]
MITSIVLGLVAMSACLALQAATLTYAVRYFARVGSRKRGRSQGRVAFLQLATLMACLMVGTLIQILIWALLYRLTGLLDDFETAAYFSGVTFTTLGYGDVLLTGRLRFLAVLQAASGVMMFGLSTAALLAAAQKQLSKRAEALPNAERRA